MLWLPTFCAVQLNFCGDRDGDVIPSGATYTGISTIRYRKDPLPLIPHVEPEGASSEYTSFLHGLEYLSRTGGLPLHAYTTRNSAAYPKVVPLEILSYKVQHVSADGKPRGLAKVLKVREEDSVEQCQMPMSGLNEAKESASVLSFAKKKNGKAKSVGGSLAAAVTASLPVDRGYKIVEFYGSAGLVEGAEVELEVHFKGTVQTWDQGGIYTNQEGARLTPSITSASLLTHFEVHLARFAFPCPDHPQYRLDWQLKSLQLPEAYHTVVTNGTLCSRKVLPSHRAVQYSFSACGPLPAYVFAFAALAGSIDSLESTLTVPPAAFFSRDSASTPAPAAEAAVKIPVRVLSLTSSQIPESVLSRVLDVVKEAHAQLQAFFHCPLPLQQCEHLDVLLAPTMPYISGMEHHCCIFLNESIYRCQGAKSHSEKDAVAQTELIVHELAHHWVGNALGLPFAVKEGVCQVLESCIGDVLLGRPMRKLKYQGHNGIVETEKGNEFTGYSYQHALLALQAVVANMGFPKFQLRMQSIVKEMLVRHMVAVEETGGAAAMRKCGEPVGATPYLSSEAFLEHLKKPA